MLLFVSFLLLLVMEDKKVEIWSTKYQIFLLFFKQANWVVLEHCLKFLYIFCIHFFFTCLSVLGSLNATKRLVSKKSLKNEVDDHDDICLEPIFWHSCLKCIVWKFINFSAVFSWFWNLPKNALLTYHILGSRYLITYTYINSKVGFSVTFSLAKLPKKPLKLQFHAKSKCQKKLQFPHFGTESEKMESQHLKPKTSPC